MICPARLVPAAALLLAVSAVAGEMKDEVKIGASNTALLRSRFATYGYRPAQTLVVDKGGLRFRLPGRVAEVTQTGIYSYFTLSGDCEVTLTYAMQNLPSPVKGYGNGLGLAFDAGDEVGRGSIQRVCRQKDEHGYVLQTNLAERGGKPKEEYQFVKIAGKQGRIALRRVEKELIFLVSDNLKKPPQEIGRLPFTDRTIRAVRVFADPGGSELALDVWAGEFQFRAEEITGGIPKSERRRSYWWVLPLIAVPGVGLLVWRWRAHRRRE